MTPGLTMEWDANGVVLVSLLLLWTYFTPCSSVSIVNYEQVNADWDNAFKNLLYLHFNPDSLFECYNAVMLTWVFLTSYCTNSFLVHLTTFLSHENYKTLWSWDTKAAWLERQCFAVVSFTSCCENILTIKFEETV